MPTPPLINPFAVLKVPLKATDAEVRAAYHELLRRFTPEQAPEEFQAVQEAYAALKTERDRWRWHLLHDGPPGEGVLDVVEKFSRLPGRSRPPGVPAFRSLLAACATAAQRDATQPSKP